MRLPTLDGRLRRIKDLLPASFERLVDVGTDHGYLPLHLLAEGRTKQALATDLRPSPLNKARCNLDRFGQLTGVSFSRCDGLKTVVLQPGDCLVIAGMGGLTIADILAAGDLPVGLRCWLQPMKSATDLLQRLPHCGLTLVNEQLTFSNGRFYRIMVAEKKVVKSDLQAESAALTEGLPLSRFLTEPAGRDRETASCWPGFCAHECKRLRKIPAGDPRRAALAYFEQELSRGQR